MKHIEEYAYGYARIQNNIDTTYWDVCNSSGVLTGELCNKVCILSATPPV